MQGNTQDLCALPNKSSPRANIEIAIKLPVYNRQHWHLDHIGHRHDDAHHRPKVSQVSTAAELTHWDFTALGDLSTWFQYEIWQRDKTNAISHLQLGLGITLSTGSTTIQNTHHILAEPTLQPGSGALSFTVAATCRNTISIPTLITAKSIHIFTSSSYPFNAKGKKAYHFGDTWLFHLGGNYPLFKWMEMYGQLTGQWQKRNHAGKTSEHTDATGGAVIYLSPGLVFNLHENLAVFSYLQFPLYQYVNQVQLISSHNLLLGLTLHY